MIRALKYIAKSNIALGDEAAAEAAVKKLLSDFSTDKSLPAAVLGIAATYRKSARYQKAIELYQYILEQWPDDEVSIHAQKGIVNSNIALGDEAAAEAAVNKLLTNFNDNPLIARAVWDTGQYYRESKKYEKANEFDRYVIDHWPKSEYVMWAKMDMAKTDIGLGNDAAVEKTIDILIADFNDHPELPTAIFILGEEYYNKAFNTKGDTNSPDARPEEYYRKALAIWERIIQKLPPSPTTPQAYWCSAVVYSQELGEYQKGIEYYQNVVDTWPDYEYAWHAQFFIGMYYEKLRDSGGIPESEVNPKIEQAYKAVVEKYPDSNSSPYAALKLGQLNFNRGQWADAAKYFELFMEKAPEGQRRGDVLYDLGRAYEKMGELDLAAEVYRTFIQMADPTDARIKTVKAGLEKLEGATK